MFVFFEYFYYFISLLILNYRQVNIVWWQCDKNRYTYRQKTGFAPQKWIFWVITRSKMSFTRLTQFLCVSVLWKCFMRSFSIIMRQIFRFFFTTYLIYTKAVQNVSIGSQSFVKWKMWEKYFCLFAEKTWTKNISRICWFNAILSFSSFNVRYRLESNMCFHQCSAAAVCSLCSCMSYIHISHVYTHIHNSYTARALYSVQLYSTYMCAYTVYLYNYIWCWCPRGSQTYRFSQIECFKTHEFRRDTSSVGGIHLSFHKSTFSRMVLFLCDVQVNPSELFWIVEWALGSPQVTFINHEMISKNAKKMSQHHHWELLSQVGTYRTRKLVFFVLGCCACFWRGRHNGIIQIKKALCSIRMCRF